MSVVEQIKKWAARVLEEEATQEIDYFEPDAEEIDCTSREMQDLLESRAWAAIVQVIKGKIRGYRDALETTREHNDIIHVQGEVYSMRTVLSLPQNIKDELRRKEKEIYDGDHQ